MMQPLRELTEGMSSGARAGPASAGSRGESGQDAFHVVDAYAYLIGPGDRMAENQSMFAG